MKQLMTMKELSGYLQKPVSWIYRNQRKLAIPYIQIGQQYRYSIEDIDIWLQNLKQQSNKDGYEYL